MKLEFRASFAKDLRHIQDKHLLNQIKEKIQEIAQLKMRDLNVNSLEAAMRVVEGSARSMGIEIE